MLLIQGSSRSTAATSHSREKLEDHSSSARLPSSLPPRLPTWDTASASSMFLIWRWRRRSTVASDVTPSWEPQQKDRQAGGKRDGQMAGNPDDEPAVKGEKI